MQHIGPKLWQTLNIIYAYAHINYTFYNWTNSYFGLMWLYWPAGGSVRPHKRWAVGASPLETEQIGNLLDMKVCLIIRDLSGEENKQWPEEGEKNIERKKSSEWLTVRPSAFKESWLHQDNRKEPGNTHTYTHYNNLYIKVNSSVFTVMFFNMFLCSTHLQTCDFFVSAEKHWLQTTTTTTMQHL